MGLDLNYENGQTPLEEEEKEGLLIPSITTREDLDEFEQLNIEKAVEWYLVRKKFRKENILTEKFILDVHKKMFNDVWSWAGQFRKTNKNIGVDKYQIGIKLRQLIDDCKFWIENKTYSDKEIAIRFKHELVSIHLFPNGNGRHSRLMADIMMKNIFKKSIFSWGHKNLANKSSARKQYIKSLKNADNGIINDLVKFAVS